MVIFLIFRDFRTENWTPKVSAVVPAAYVKTTIWRASAPKPFQRRFSIDVGSFFDGFSNDFEDFFVFS
jgi:hypothetical protein